MITVEATLARRQRQKVVGVTETSSQQPLWRAREAAAGLLEICFHSCSEEHREQIARLMVDYGSMRTHSGANAPQILVVEDEENIAFVVTLALRASSFEVSAVRSGAEALSIMRGSTPPDMVVLDVVLPDTDGFTLCARLRSKNNQTPILFLTARDSVPDRLYGLTIGGDDYLTKPFSVDELVARVKVILRRAGRQPASKVLRHEDLSLDEDAHRVVRGDRDIYLTPTEFKLLRVLMKNANLVISKAQILDHVWDYEFIGEESVVETYMSSLRKKLGADGHRIIETVRGYGYRFGGTAYQ